MPTLAEKNNRKFLKKIERNQDQSNHLQSWFGVQTARVDEQKPSSSSSPFHLHLFVHGKYLYSRYRPNRGYDGSSIIPAGWFKLTRSDQQKSKNLIPKNTIPCHYSNRFLFLKCCTHTYHGWRELLTASFRLLNKHHMTVFSTYSACECRRVMCNRKRNNILRFFGCILSLLLIFSPAHTCVQYRKVWNNEIILNGVDAPDIESISLNTGICWRW